MVWLLKWRYDEPWRHYNFEHPLESVCNFARQSERSGKNLGAVAWAWRVSRCYRRPLRRKHGRNEELSAQLAGART